VATLEEFTKMQFEEDDFRPFTGEAHLGNFSAYYIPASGDLSIGVRIKLDFTDSKTGKWTKPDQDLFKKNLPLIAKDWNDNFLIKCMKPGWEKLKPAKPRFQLIEYAPPHYTMKVIAALKDCGNFVRPEGDGQLWAQSADRLAKAATSMINTKKDMKLPFCIPIDKPGGAQFSVQSLSTLETFATMTKLIMGDNTSKFNVELVGFGVKNDKTKALDPKANKANAEKVKSILEQFCGLKVKYQLFACEDEKPEDPSGRGYLGLATMGVVVYPNVDDIERFFPKDPTAIVDILQAPLVHEFGHMLGLPDEYNLLCSESVDTMVGIGVMGPNAKMIKEDEARLKDFGAASSLSSKSPRITAHQKAYIELCRDAGMPPPVFGKSTPSMMSVGTKFMAHHCVTVWKALCDMTKDHVKPDEWVVKLL